MDNAFMNSLRLQITTRSRLLRSLINAALHLARVDKMFAQMRNMF